MKTKILLGAVFASVMTSGVAHAATSITGNAQDGLQAMRELNLIVLGNLHANGQETEGKAYVGGNLTGSGTNFGIGGNQAAAASDRATLTVGGNNTNRVQINNGNNGGQGQVATAPGMLVGGNSVDVNLNAAGATLNIGGNLTGNMNLNGNLTLNVGGSVQGVNGSGGITVNAGQSISGNQNGAKFNQNLGSGWNAETTSVYTMAETAKLSADLKALSSELAGLATTAGNSLTNSHGQMVIKAYDGGEGYSVLNLNGAELGNQLDILMASAGMPLIVNVSGKSLEWNLNSVGGYNKSLNPYIIWNFFEAETISFNRMVHGSVLAPNASITNSTPLEGSVAVANMIQSGEVHLGTYAGNDNFLQIPTGGDNAIMAVPGVPEAETWGMLILGFGLVGVAMRRRRGVNRSVLN